MEAAGPLDLLPAPLCGQRWGTVVHVGAGAALPQVDADAVVLVDGDPAACARLRAKARGRASLRVLHRVVGERAGQATWFRHSWSAADGLANLGDALHNSHPRVACIDTAAVDVTSLADLVAELPPATPSSGDDVLLLDVPSGADALVASLPPALAVRFAWIVAGGLPSGGAAGAHLHSQRGSRGPGSWHWRVWRVDADGWRTAVRLMQTESDLAATRERLVSTASERDDLAALALQRQSIAHGLAGQLADAEFALDALRGEAQQAAKALADAVSERDALRSAAAELVAAQTRLAALQAAEAKIALVAEILLAERLQ